MFETSPHFRIQGLLANFVRRRTSSCIGCQHDQPPNDVDEANACILTLTFSLWATGDHADERQLFTSYCERCGSDADAELELIGKATKIIENRWRDPALTHAIPPFRFNSDEDEQPPDDLPKDSVP